MTEKTHAKRFMIMASFSAMIATILGAFAAHGLKAQFSSYQLDVFKTGIFYQFIHSLALLSVGLILLHFKNQILYFSGWFFLSGIVLFSGGLYLLILTKVQILGIITPLGGACLILGWFFLAIGLYKTE